MGAVPDHVPGDPVKTCPAVAVPETVGALVFTGADAAELMVAVGADTAVADPAPFDPVTATRTVAPTSAATNV